MKGAEEGKVRVGGHIMTFWTIGKKVKKVMDVVQMLRDKVNLKVESLSCKLQTLVDQENSYSQPKKMSCNIVEDVATI